MKAFITSQFGYCPLVWMFHSRRINNRINRLHERSLRLTYNDYNSTFQELLHMDNFVNIHQRNWQAFATLLHKVLNNLSPEIVRETFYNTSKLHIVASKRSTSVFLITLLLLFLTCQSVVVPENKRVKSNYP